MLDVFAQLLSAARQNPVLAELGQWFSHLYQNAPSRWGSSVITGARCECGRPAMGPCAICHHPTCLGHALVSASAEIVCFVCVRRASRREWTERASNGGSQNAGARWQRGDDPFEPSKPSHADRAKYLKRLGLKPGASMEDIKAAWKRLALKNHPDRASEGRRAAAEKRMREINEAYQWLISHASEEAA